MWKADPKACKTSKVPKGNEKVYTIPDRVAKGTGEVMACTLCLYIKRPLPSLPLATCHVLRAACYVLRATCYLLLATSCHAQQFLQMCQLPSEHSVPLAWVLHQAVCATHGRGRRSGCGAHRATNRRMLGPIHMYNNVPCMHACTTNILWLRRHLYTPSLTKCTCACTCAAGLRGL